MEQNLAGKPNDKIIPSGNRDFDKVKPNANASRGVDSLPKDPVYQSDRHDASKLSESYEGFTPSKDIGMDNLEKSDGFGSKFQMPGPDMSEKYMNEPTGETNGTQRPMQSRSLNANTAAPVEFVDIQTTLATLQDLVVKIRANLESPEQGELEALMLQGSQLLQSHWKLLSTTATTQVSSLKSDVKENPYRALIAALKVGMAISQVVSATRSGVQAPIDSGETGSELNRVAL
jgi:hypothetical protein